MKGPSVTDEIKAMSDKAERDKQAKIKRQWMAQRIAVRGACAIGQAQIEDVLVAMREAGYRIIEAERIIDHHAINLVSDEEMHHARNHMPDFEERMRIDLGRKLGAHIAARGGIDFETRKTNLGHEVRADIYVIHANPNVRDEKG